MELRSANGVESSVKLLLNLCLIAAGAVPRGGVIAVDLSGEGDAMTMRVEAKGANARLSHSATDFLTNAVPNELDRRPFHSTLFHDASGARVPSDAQRVNFAGNRYADGRSSASDEGRRRLQHIPLTTHLPRDRAVAPHHAQ